MQTYLPAYHIRPVGDQVIEIGFGNRMDPGLNAQVVALYQSLRQDPLPGITEMVPAYSSLAIFYDPGFSSGRLSVYESLERALEERIMQPLPTGSVTGKEVRVPVCYDPALVPGLNDASRLLGLDIDAIIRLHTAPVYRVYMNGFLPGFPYMGEVDSQITMARKPKPERVPAGSVGIAGKQTGIYPMDAPGGWHIIGRTPLKIFDADREEAVLLQAGDSVQFYPVSKTQFDNWYSQES